MADGASGKAQGGAQGGIEGIGGLLAGLFGAAKARLGLAAEDSGRTAGDGTAGARREAERLGSSLPPLLVAAERVAATVAQGVHGRRRVGMGDSFWQFRRFAYGDARSQVDWRRSARSDHLFVRENEWEAAQSVWLWRDPSGSMDWRSGAALPVKRDRATVLLLALAVLLSRAGEHLALLGTGMAPRAGRGTLDRIVERMLLAEAGAAEKAETDLPPLMPLPRHGVLVWISDFLAPVEETLAVIDHYVARGVTGHLVQVLDPAESDLPWDGRAMFEGLEQEAPLLVPRVDGIRAAYRQRLQALQDTLAAQARRADWSFTVHRTDRPAQVPLLTLYTALADAPGRRWALARAPRQMAEATP